MAKRAVWLLLVMLVVLIGLVLVGRPRGLGQPGGLPAAHAEVVQSDRPRNTSPDIAADQLVRLAADNNAFAFDLYQRLRSGGSNLFLSPYSISAALAMTYAGARGETAREMAQALCFYLPPEQLHPAFNALDLQLASRGEGAVGRQGRPFQLHVANALWCQSSWRFLPDFLDLLAEHYGTGVRLVDFVADAEGARSAINQWVSDETNGRIRELVPADALDRTECFVLTNAVYFDAAWQHKFRKELTEPGYFYLPEGRRITVDMMRQTAEFGYAEGEGYQALEMPYRGGELTMVILLPAPARFEAFDASCDSARVGQIIADLSRGRLRRVSLTVPRFTFESAFRLDQALSEMGMRRAFIFPMADFSGIDGTHLLYLTAVLHKALVRVDEEGTEAAAATAVIGRPGGAGGPMEIVEFIVDRPFIFLIRDVKTGAILFLGRVLDPRG